MTARRISRAWVSHVGCVAVLVLLSAASCKQGREITGITEPDAGPDSSVKFDSGGDAVCGSPTDPRNCGSCGNDCTALPNVKPGAAGITCQAGVCNVPSSACATGFGHCTTRSSDVCETNLADSQNCGACGTKCSTAAPLCVMGASGLACGTACTGTAKDVCGSSCVNLQSDPKNCGTCGHDCGALPNVAAGATGITCQAGVCSVPASACLSGFAHCSPRPDEGCEADLGASPNCGGCGVTCSGSTPICSAASGTAKCASNCTGTAPDVCSTACVNLKSDPKNCGSCGHDCASLPNVKPGATVSCQSGICSVPAASCLGGFAHCSSRPDDGCETDLTQPQNCGQCGRACAAPTALCSTTSSTPSCASSCVAPAPNLCGTKCVDFQSDALNCGSCGHDCTALDNVKTGASGIECRTGVCYVPPSACVTGFAHCSTKADDGCEASLTTTTNCGKCGTACSAPTGLCSTTNGAPTCSSSCVAPSPDLCGSRCVDFQSDPANCGSCGHNCGALPNVKSGATTQCLAGVCSIPPTSCLSGFAHCSGAADLGCESSFTSPNTCGSCTTKCASPTGLCSTTSGAPMCSSSCVSPAPDLCTTKCVNLMTDPLNCGSCGFNCGALPNVKPGATVSCVSGVCSIPSTSCASGFAHCTGSGNAGCETNLSQPATCGSCTKACASPTGLCSTTTGVPTCSSSCVSPAPDLCTTKCVNLMTDPLNCGTCGFKCSALPNVNPSATVSCVSGVCSIPSTSCVAGFAHCSGSGNLGCETNLNLPATCGSCTTKCAAPTANCAPSPTTGLPVCSSSCVSPTPDLCTSTSTCVSLASDPVNCGSCGHNCTTLMNVRTAQNVTCVNKACVVPASSCATGFAHCGTNADLGCETSIKTNTNCGACNAPCNNATNATGSCATGTCMQTCNGGFADCNKTAPDCETPINTTSNCGGCGITCNAASCSTTNGVVSFQAAGTCSPSSLTCTQGASSNCNGFACASATACATACSGTTTGCAAGFFCSGGTRCVAAQATGTTCTSGSQCATGFCVDSVCCATACSLSASGTSSGCMSCAAVTNGVANGTCAQRVGFATSACPTANPNACVPEQTDPKNCGGCGVICPAAPSGEMPACYFGKCDVACTGATSQICHYQSLQMCQSTAWTFETTATGETFWNNGDNNSKVVDNKNGTTVDTAPQFPTLSAHKGTGSLEVTATSDGSAPRMLNFPCVTQPDTGTMKLAGRTFSASILMPAGTPNGMFTVPGTPAQGGNFGATNCQLGYLDASLNYVVIAQVAPVVPNAYFSISGVFPSTTPAAVSAVVLQCTVPPTWSIAGGQVWYVDDVSISN